MDDPLLSDEPGRLAALRRYLVLDTVPETQFDKIVTLVRTVFKVPIATVTLVDQDRQWFKAQFGLAVPGTPRAISFCTHTIRQRAPLIVADARADPRFSANPLVTGEPYLRSYAGVPLCSPDGYNVGSLCAMDVVPREFSVSDVAILESFASLVIDELELRQIAQRDQLTGALTRRGFVDLLVKDIARRDRYARPSSLLMFDVDRFKAINDSHGHPAGDRVLQSLADICSGAMRPVDALGRIGGEEFALLLPETGHVEAMAAAERFRMSIERHVFTASDGRRLPVTASFGVATLNDTIVDAMAWIAAADAPLYAAKRAGRNRCGSAEARGSLAA